MVSAVSSSAPITGPVIVPRPPVRLTPPSTTAATELSRNEVFAAGSAAPIRATRRIEPIPASTPEIAYTAILIRAVLMPVAVAASAEPPVASTWVPKRVQKSTPWAMTAITAAMMTVQPKMPRPPVESLSRNVSMTVTGLPSARMSAAPEAAESMPSVTMKSVILPRAMTMPLIAPAIVLTATAATHDHTRPQ